MALPVCLASLTLVIHTRGDLPTGVTLTVGGLCMLAVEPPQERDDGIVDDLEGGPHAGEDKKLQYSTHGLDKGGRREGASESVVPRFVGPQWHGCLSVGRL